MHTLIFGDEMRECEFHAGVDSTPSQFRFSPCAPHTCPTMETDQCVPSHFTDRHTEAPSVKDAPCWALATPHVTCNAGSPLLLGVDVTHD